jgi:hypothetical protein
MRLGRNRYRAAPWLLLGVLVFGAGCAKAPSGAQLSDEIHTNFKQDSGLRDKSITVRITGDVVTLSGLVDNDAERTAAARYASRTTGIKEVVNDLQIAVPAPSAEVGQNDQPVLPPPASSARAPRHPPSTARQPQEKAARDDSSDRQPSSPVSLTSTGSSASDSSSAKAITDPSPASTEEQVTNAVPSRKTEAPPDPPPAPEPPDAPAPPASDANSDAKLMTIEAGTPISIRLVDDIDSETAQAGQTFRATLDSPLSVEWDVAIPAGYNVEGHVAEVKSAGKFAGQSELVLTLDKILVHDKTYDIQTDEYRRKGKNQSTNTAEKVGVGAALGAIIGGIAGGGKGAGIGAAAGGGLGGASQAAGKGAPVRLTSETLLHFTLQSPLTMTRVEQDPEQERRKLKPTK